MPWGSTKLDLIITSQTEIRSDVAQVLLQTSKLYGVEQIVQNHLAEWQSATTYDIVYAIMCAIKETDGFDSDWSPKEVASAGIQSLRAFRAPDGHWNKKPYINLDKARANAKLYQQRKDGARSAARGGPPIMDEFDDASFMEDDAPAASSSTSERPNPPITKADNPDPEMFEADWSGLDTPKPYIAGWKPKTVTGADKILAGVAKTTAIALTGAAAANEISRAAGQTAGAVGSIDDNAKASYNSGKDQGAADSAFEDPYEDASPRKCGQCGTVMGDSKFCPSCGTSANSGPKKCGNCNAELSAAALFCEACGVEVRS